MPNYDYHCTHCGHSEEVFQKMSEDLIKKCPSCQKDTFKRGPGGGIGLQFQGSGFYINDYPQNGKNSGSPSPNELSKEKKSDHSGCCPCGKNSFCS